jgi:rhodanese-related sulfurtransferase
MSRFQLSLNVHDVDASVEFYTKLFGVAPAKHRDGYANFIVEDPPMKLIVIESEGAPGSINHVGIEYESGADVATHTERIAALDLPVTVDDPHTCCFATQEKAWTLDKDGVPWELYTVVDDTDNFGANPHGGTQLDVLLPPVTVDELEAALADPDVVVVDAQGDGISDKAHIAGAVNFDLNTVEEQAATEIGDKDQRVVLYCTDKDCLGAEFVGTLLVEAGYTNVGRFPGGVDGWGKSGRPVESDSDSPVGS